MLCLQEIKAGASPLDVSRLCGAGLPRLPAPGPQAGLQRRGHVFSSIEPKAVVHGCGQQLLRRRRPRAAAGF
ncbi:MAG: hypothetical protein WKG07_09245 [Hymenobacter sp.]